jgi:alanine racemase
MNSHPTDSSNRRNLVQVRIDLSQIRRNTLNIIQSTGVDVIAVVKADAYGLGAIPVSEAIADLVHEFCVFRFEEATAARLWERTHKPTLCLGPSTGISAEQLIAAHVRPAVWTVEEAARLRDASPILTVDTGMQRFACPPDQIDAVLDAGQITEAMTHATRIEHVEMLLSLVGSRGLRLHAAASALLDDPRARLNAVRPGLALYRGATRVSARLVEVRDANGPAGYSGFLAPRFGVILCGYSNGLRRGPCLVNGSRQSILEVGMQSAFVEVGPNDHPGDEVVLLGDGLTELEVATAWGATPQHVSFALSSAGEREYAG